MRPIIFDYDGVIADSEQMIAEAMAETLTEFGLPTTIEQSLERYLGRSHKDTRALIAEHFGGALPDGMEETTSRRISAKIETGLRPVPGIEPFLKKNAGRLIAIASSSSKDWIISGLDRFELSTYFQPTENKVFSAVGLPRAKPHPDVYLHAAKELDIDIKSAIIIEDSTNGIKAGKAAGGLVIGVRAASHIRADTKDKQLNAGADYSFETFEEVQALIKELDQ